MMKNKKIKLSIFTFLAIAVLFSSCENYLTKTIPFEDIGYEPLLVVNAKVSSLTDSLFISVSKNNNYADASRAEFILIPNVDLKLTVDGSESYDAIPFNGPENLEDIYNYMIIFDNADLSGKTFVLEASHTDYPDVRSEIFLANNSQYLGVDFEKDAISDFQFGEEVTFDRIKFTMKDEAGSKNYYSFNVRTEPFVDTIIQDYGGTIDTFIFENQGYKFGAKSNDADAVNLDGFTRELLFSDKDFDGEQRTFEILFQAFGENYVDFLLVEYSNISESEFLFRQSYQKYRSSQDFGIFSEPTTLFSNIENGLGIFGGQENQLFKVN